MAQTILTGRPHRIGHADCLRVIRFRFLEFEADFGMARATWGVSVVDRKTPCALPRAAVLLALALLGPLLGSLALPAAAAAAALSTKLPPPSSTVFECTVNGRPEFTDRPCIAEGTVEVVKVMHVAMESEPAQAPRAAELPGDDSASYNVALLLASFACMAYLLRGRGSSK